MYQDTDKTCKSSYMYQDSDKMLCAWALRCKPDKTLLIAILNNLFLSNTAQFVFFLYANILLSQFEPLFRLPRDMFFAECLLSHSGNSQHMLLNPIKQYYSFLSSK